MLYHSKKQYCFASFRCSRASICNHQRSNSLRETIKLNIIADKDWLEAIWIKEVTAINDVEKEVEVDDELTKETVQEESVTTEQIHCESFSGHKEHIVMLEAKAKEFNTSLDEYTELIQLCKDSFVYPTEDELAKEELQNKIQEANQYLIQTDWVNNYKTRHDLGLELIPEESSKWEVINKREEYIVFLKAIEGGK